MKTKENLAFLHVIDILEIIAEMHNQTIRGVLNTTEGYESFKKLFDNEQKKMKGSGNL